MVSVARAAAVEAKEANIETAGVILGSGQYLWGPGSFAKGVQ
jgi:hypothetical protein